MDPLIRITSLESVIEAEVAEAVLSEMGIVHRVRCYHDMAYDGLFQLQKGWGAIYARSSDRDTVLAVLEDLRTRTGCED